MVDSPLVQLSDSLTISKRGEDFKWQQQVAGTGRSILMKGSRVKLTPIYVTARITAPFSIETD